jgi:hypothetical protein
VEGRRVAAALQDVAAAIITGPDANAAAEVALAIAAIHSGERRVAIADLVGGIERLSAISDAVGLLECLRDGEPISEIARPLTADGAIFALPAGRGPIAERWVYESARWVRLIGGFREVDALLLLITPPHAPGLETLIARVDGVVAVDLPPTQVREWPLLATVDRPEPELPAIPGTPRLTPRQTPAPRPPQRRWARWAAIPLLAAAAAYWFVGRSDGVARSAIGTSADAATASTPPGTPPGTPPTAELRIDIGPIVNPADSALATRFAVELVAANTLASANSRLAALEGGAPTPTVAPVILGGSGHTWYRALVGAWPTRDRAASWLAAERTRGLLRAEVGRVVEVPLALQLGAVTTVPAAREMIATWEARGISAYALTQEQGRIRVYAGAFESPAQAVVLAMMLRELGAEPRLAYRIGRSF